jgi:hypothetical protein
VPVSALADLGADVRVAVNLHHRPVRELSLSRRRNGGRRAALTARLSDLFEEGVARLRGKTREVTEGDEEETALQSEALPNLFEILTASMSVLEYELAQHRLARERVDVLIEPELDGRRPRMLRPRHRHTS